MMHCCIDFQLLNRFFKQIAKHVTETGENLSEVFNSFFEIIDYQFNSHSQLASPEFVKSAIRGLVMLLQLPEMEHFDFFPLFEQIVRLLKQMSNYLKRQSTGNESQFLINFLSHCLPKHEFQQTIQKFQNYITLVIIQNIFNQEQIMLTIQVMDLFFLANQRKLRKDKIKDSEFYNDALNKDVDLKKQAQIYYQEWMNAKKHNRPFDRHEFFTLYNYPWTLNAYKKAELFNIISSMERYDMIGQALLQNLNNIMDPNNGLNNILNATSFNFKIRRDNILEDSLNGLVSRTISNA